MTHPDDRVFQLSAVEADCQQAPQVLLLARFLSQAYHVRGQQLRQQNSHHLFPISGPRGFTNHPRPRQSRRAGHARPPRVSTVEGLRRLRIQLMMILIRDRHLRSRWAFHNQLTSVGPAHGTSRVCRGSEDDSG